MTDKIIHKESLTDEVQEVISYRPHWIVRKGNTLFLLIILGLLSLTFVIQYPDIINAPARLVALNPPKQVTAKTDGKLLKLFVVNDQEVQKGQPLGYMESTANYEQVISLQHWVNEMVDSLQGNNYSLLSKRPLPSLSGLGELQVNFQAFQNQLELTKQTLANGYFQKKRSALQKDIAYLSDIKSSTQQQKKLIEQNKSLDQTEYEAYEKLAREKVIAPLELNQYKIKLITKEQNLKQADEQVTTTNMSSHTKQKEILDLQKQVSDLHQQFYSSLLDIKSQIEKWKQQYELTAPESGKIIFVASLNENELVGNGQNLFYVQPEQTAFYAELMAGQQGFGKIKKGQKIIIKIESYPSTEFGYLTGTVNYISSIPNRRDSFQIKAELPKGLQTNYGNTIFFRNSLIATSEIVTENRRLFDRLAGQLKNIISR